MRYITDGFGRVIAVDTMYGCSTSADFIPEEPILYEPTKPKFYLCDWCAQRAPDDKYGGCSRCGGPRE